MTLEALRKYNIFVGTSSWKYEGWKGLVYQKHYPSKKQFEDTCLEEFPYSCVGVDHTYYNWPNPRVIEKYTRQTQAQLGLKVTERTTVIQYPKLARYGERAGKANPEFLDPELFQRRFLEPLKPYQEQIGCLIFEFSHFYPGTFDSGRSFLQRLATFFSRIERIGMRFAIELRNRTWITREYFDFLQQTDLGHVFNSWTKMPTIAEQMEVWDGTPLPFIASRVLLKPGVSYDSAVKTLAPYDRIQLEQPELRKQVAGLIDRAIALSIPAYVFVNNRAEGCAPQTIQAILSRITNRG